jgi:hypothetical protein
VLSDELIRAPEAMLRALCAALELPWQPSMLHWAPGPKPYDGVWAPWWYANTHKSTGGRGATGRALWVASGAGFLWLLRHAGCCLWLCCSPAQPTTLPGISHSGSSAASNAGNILPAPST